MEHEEQKDIHLTWTAEEGWLFFATRENIWRIPSLGIWTNGALTSWCDKKDGSLHVSSVSHVWMMPGFTACLGIERIFLTRCKWRLSWKKKSKISFSLCLYIQQRTFNSEQEISVKKKILKPMNSLWSCTCQALTVKTCSNVTLKSMDTRDHTCMSTYSAWTLPTQICRSYYTVQLQSSVIYI